MTSIKNYILKWWLVFTNRKEYKRRHRKGECKRCGYCCNHLLGFVRCPYLGKDNLCRLQKKKPFSCVYGPIDLDKPEKFCGYHPSNIKKK